jgi:hypothetical protein
MPDPTSPRRRFQFRLRTLLIAVTLICVVAGYVGRQASIVRERRAELSRPDFTRLVGFDDADTKGAVSWIRRALGDKSVRAILYPVGTDAAELDRLRVLFPEASVSIYTSGASFTR